MKNTLTGILPSNFPFRNHFNRHLIFAAFILLFTACIQKHKHRIISTINGHKAYIVRGDPMFEVVPRDIRIKDFFKFIDSLAMDTNTISGFKLNEYLIVHANSWILDSLKNSDYYFLKRRGFFQYDQRETVLLHRGDRLVMPDSCLVEEINQKLKTSIIDVNIPEYKLRIIQSGDTILTCNVRVGKPETMYLGTVGHEVNLETPVGTGKIIRIERNPDYTNPDDGKRYDSTLRDDGKYTKMPIIPWIEPSINGIRYGDMIHATTNPSTLGKAYSHGCIGTTESDAWTIYFNAPIGTKVVFRYNLKIKNKKGDNVDLRDVYHLGS